MPVEGQGGFKVKAYSLDPTSRDMPYIKSSKVIREWLNVQGSILQSLSRNLTFFSIESLTPPLFYNHVRPNSSYVLPDPKGSIAAFALYEI